MKLRNVKTWLSCIAVIGSLTACGGGNSTDAGNGVGRVGLILTDAPTNDFAEVNITINQVILMGGSGSNTTLFDGEKTVNLLSLENFGQLLSLTDVPAGQYSKVRLILKHPDGIELVRKNAAGEVTERIRPKQPGNGKLDLNPRGSFTVTSNTTVYLQLDIDAKKSIHIVETGNGKYIFRPVIFVDALSEQLTGKLVRQFGYVQSIDADNKTFRLCPSATSTEETSSNEHCTNIKTENASVFDNQANATTFDALTVNQPAMIVGIVSFNVPFDEKKTDDNTSKKPYGSMSYQLNAEVVELGEIGQYKIIRGTIKSDAADLTSVVNFTRDDTTELTIQLQSPMKVFSRSGQKLGIDSVKTNTIGSFDGVWSDNEQKQLRSTLLIINDDTSTDGDHLSGTISSVDETAKSFTLATKSGGVRVIYSDETQYFYIVENNDELLSNRTDASALKKFARVDAYGKLQTGGKLAASVIVIQQIAE